MAKTTAWENALLELVFNNNAVPFIGDDAGLVGSTTAGNLYISLHTADPTSGDQTLNETNYVGYARVPVARTSDGWTVSGGSVTNNITIYFPICTGGASTVNWVGVGTSSSGAGELLYSGQLNIDLIISNNITPTFKSQTLIISES